MAKKKHFTADEIMQYISCRISLARADEDYETVNFFRRLGVSVIKTMYDDTRQLTPEILTAAGWKEEENTFFNIGFSKDINDEKFGKTTDFDAYMVVVFRKFPKSKTYHVQFDVERTLGDSFHTNFRRQITVGEFNTLLDIVKLQKFQIK